MSYGYDTASAFGKGRLAAISTLTGVASATTYSSYDALGRVKSSSQTTNGNSYSFGYGYSAAGTLTSETYPSGRVVNTCYDIADRVSQVGGAACGNTAGAYASSVQYAVQGAVSGYQYGNGLQRTATFNSRLQPITMVDQKNGQTLLNMSWSWNPANGPAAGNNGNVRGAISAAGGAAFTQTFGYDGVNRLTAATDSGGWSRTFSYDAFGNMTATGNPTPPSVSFNGNNQIVGATYDQAGNQQSVNGNTLAYDFENRISSETDGVSQAVETYVYDGDGRRVEKYGPGGSPKTVFVYDAFGQLAAEYATAAAPPPCVTCYLSADSLGTARLVTDSSGSVIARHDYLPFGEEVNAYQFGRDGTWGSGNDNVNQKFTGKERDAESGLDYFGTRYYGSALGRFTSADDGSDQDPGDPQSWDLYSYVRNNPLRNIDASGRDCITTSNQTSSGVTVTTERGGSAETCSGTYVNGTVNTNSYQYNGTSLSYSFGNDTASGAGTIAFSKYSNDDWAPGSSNMLGAAQIGGSQALVNEFMKQAAIGAAAGVAGRVIGAGVDAFLAARAARAAAAAVDIANLSNKIVRQMASRGWTAQEIVETVQNGKSYSVLNKATGGAATEYVNPASGKFVVVDNATKQVLQVSGSGFSPNHLIP